MMHSSLKYIVLSSSVLLAACATAPTTSLENKDANAGAETLHVEHNNSLDNGRKECAYVLRDLSIGWPSRHYWCDDSGEGVVNADQRVAVSDLTLSAIERSRQRLSMLRDRMMGQWPLTAATPVAPEPYFISQPIAPLNQEVIQEIVIEASPRDVMVAQSVPVDANSDDVQRIWFATGREVLGPQGRRQARDLIPRIKKAQAVTLRGLLLNDEFLLKDKFALKDGFSEERRSAGRAISVRELWKDAGIDTSTIAILHYTPETQGQYVEVIIRD